MVSSGHRVGTTAALHRYCKAKSYSYINTLCQMFKAVGHYCCSARYTAQPWSPPAGHHPTVSASSLHLDCSPPSPCCFLSPHPPLSSLLSSPEAAWRLLPLLLLDTHPAWMLLKAFFCTPGISPKMELVEHLHLSYTIIFSPSY